MHGGQVRRGVGDGATASGEALTTSEAHHLNELRIAVLRLHRLLLGLGLVVEQWPLGCVVGLVAARLGGVSDTSGRRRRRGRGGRDEED